LFSLGVILWELLAGERLFPHDRPTVAAERLRARRLPRPSEFRNAPRDFERVVMKLLRRRRDRRYFSAAAALDALAWCRGASMLRGRVELVELLAQRFPDQAAHRLTRRPPLPHTPTAILTPVRKKATPRGRDRWWRQARRFVRRRRSWMSIAAIYAFLVLGLVTLVVVR
jgi:hypothetical protein